MNAITLLTAVVSEEINPSFVLELPRRLRVAVRSSSSAGPPPCERIQRYVLVGYLFKYI